MDVVPFLLNSASTAAWSAPVSVTAKLVAERISTLAEVDRVRVALPSPLIVSADTVMSLVAPMVLTRLVPVTVSTWVAMS